MAPILIEHLFDCQAPFARISSRSAKVSYPPPTLRSVKILHTADWHVGRTIRGRSRHDEHVAVLGELVDLARNRAVDLVLVGGDQFDTANPAPASEELVYRTLLSLAELAPVVMVAGNHDHPGRLEAVAPLLALGRVRVATHLARPDQGGVVRPVDGIAVAMIPFVSQRNIVTVDDLMRLDADRHGGKYASRMAAVIEALVGEFDDGEAGVLLGHIMVHGGEVGGGERAAHTVFDYSIPAQAFPGDLSYAALGHLHRHQRVAAAAPVWYPGSPLQLDFGEVDDAKGVLLVEVEPGLPAKVEFGAFAQGRRLRNLRGDLSQIEAAAADLDPSDYVRVQVDEPARAGLADTVRDLIPGAVDVVLDPSRRDRRRPARAQQAGRSHRELLVEYLESKDATDERVMALFDELLAEAHEA